MPDPPNNNYSIVPSHHLYHSVSARFDRRDSMEKEKTVDEREEEKAIRDMLSIVESVLTPFMRDWLSSNRLIDKKVLVGNLTSAIV